MREDSLDFDPDRRAILKAAASMALVGIPRELWALEEGEEVIDFADLDGYRVENGAENPRVKFFDLRRLTSWKTPQDEFFVFHQTRTVQASLADWRLRIGGFVDKPRELTLDQIRQRTGRRELAVTIECSGNNAYATANGQVSNGVWTGVGLAPILKECRLRPEAREVAFFGMDLERERDAPAAAAHGRSLSVQDALDPDTMLAYALNGSPLSPEHGFPLRLIVPGWYGMTQIKWLNRIEVLDRRYEGSHMARNYHTIRGAGTLDAGTVLETSISKTRLKSVIARVTRRKDAKGGYAYRISGAAWGGPSALKAVEVRVDESAWRAARLGERGGDFAWTLWSIDWNEARPGPHALVSRAIDVAANFQPTSAEWQASVISIREDNSQWVRRIVIPSA
jgi:DMSO/TMAO reductase YedYZ molybdopterin-dependent catalytic subunit